MKLQDMIRARGLKQGWVADQVGVGRSHFSEIVRGIRRLPLKMVRPLAKLLDVSTDDVLDAIECEPAAEAGREPT